MLSRANTLGDELFLTTNKLWIVTSYPEELPPDNNQLLSRFEMHQGFSWTNKREEQEDQFPWVFLVAETKWKLTEFDWVFDLIAEDLARVVFFDPLAGIALAPYDGGFDIIGADPIRIKQLEGKYASWRSNGPGRL